MRLGGAVMKGANIAGWVGLAAELGADAYVKKHPEKAGKAADKALSIGGATASGAALGATIGSFIPILGQTGIGQLAGALIGGTVGAIRGSSKVKKRGLYRELGEGGISLNGDYSNKELKAIRAAMKGSGEVSDKLMEKMQKNGDTVAIDQLNQIKNNIFKVQVVGAQKRGTGGPVSGSKSSGVDNTIVMATPGELVLNDRQVDTLYNAIRTHQLHHRQLPPLWHYV